MDPRCSLWLGDSTYFVFQHQIIVEEQRYSNSRNYEMTSFVRDTMKSSSNPTVKLKSSTLILKSGQDEDVDDAERSSNDTRSRTLLMKTAFWIIIWYGCSLATLFLNKIILSRPNASVHVLGMCQMTAAVVLGAWSAFGGADWIYNSVICSLRSLPEKVQSKLGVTESRVKEENISDNTKVNVQQSSTPSNPEASSSMSFHFARDMSIVGVLRGSTVLLGLVALEHVPVSFVETIKATAPVFTVIFAWLILKERTATPVVFTLVPVIAGLILCSASELSFNIIGFTAAVMNNCADCIQNVMSKRLLAHLKPTQLQFYTSVAALLLQTPFVLGDITTLLRSWTSHETGMSVSVEATMADDDEDASFHTGMSLKMLLLIDAVFYQLQSVSAYCVMGCMSPVSQSVANTLKRSLLVWASILYFHNPVTTSGIIGIIMVVSGVFLYNHVRKIHHS
mmetsp:Transcript_3795/g.4373  ORF Transcript_3795/g.4373 Transcript_3795/m.4373 type:complete len:451 (-) Transcript_3795:50-1402(-)